MPVTWIASGFLDLYVYDSGINGKNMFPIYRSNRIQWIC